MRVQTPVALLRSLSGKCPWERYEPPYPPSYGLNSTTNVHLGEWLWHWIIYKGWYAIKQRNQTFIYLFHQLVYWIIPIWPWFLTGVKDSIQCPYKAGECYSLQSACISPLENPVYEFSVSLTASSKSCPSYLDRSWDGSSYNFGFEICYFYISMKWNETVYLY